MLRAANQNLTIASGNCTIMYRWHGAAVTDEGLASPHGRGAPWKGRRGRFLPSQSLRDSSPRVGARGKNGLPHQCEHYSALRAGFAGCALYTPAGVVARNDSNCRNALQERYRAVPNRITNTDQPCTHCQRRLAANFFKSLLTK